jgi:hypothetical protein
VVVVRVEVEAGKLVEADLMQKTKTDFGGRT